MTWPGRAVWSTATAWAACAAIVVTGVGAQPGNQKPAPPVAPNAASGGVTFTDVTAPAGIRFIHNSGRAGRKWLPETMGAGVAFFDADGDGWSDLLFVNGRD